MYLAYLIDKGLIALKVIKKEKYDENELKAVFEFEKFARFSNLMYYYPFTPLFLYKYFLEKNIKVFL